jgi:hypothetical protein
MVRVHSGLPFQVSASFSTCDFLPVFRSMRSDTYLQLDCVASTLKVGASQILRGTSGSG